MISAIYFFSLVDSGHAWCRFTVSKIGSLRSLNWSRVVLFETSTEWLRLLANLKSVSIINYLFEMQMYKKLLTFLHYHFVALYFCLYPWSLQCLRWCFNAKCFKFPGNCKPSVTGYAIVCSRCVLMGKHISPQLRKGP